MTAERGVFWLPSEPEKRVPGHLVVTESGTPSVELHEPLTPLLKVVSHDPHTGTTEWGEADGLDDLLVYGFLENSRRLVTFVDCLEINRKEVSSAKCH